MNNRPTGMIKNPCRSLSWLISSSKVVDSMGCMEEGSMAVGMGCMAVGSKAVDSMGCSTMFGSSSCLVGNSGCIQ